MKRYTFFVYQFFIITLHSLFCFGISMYFIMCTCLFVFFLIYIV